MGSLIRLCPPPLIRVHTALFLLPLVQNVYFEHQSFVLFCFVFNSFFGFWQLCQIFLWAGLTWQRWGPEVSWDDEVDPNHLVDLEVMITSGLPNLTVCCEPTPGHNQDWWPSKTTGAQALNLAPHAVKSGKYFRGIDQKTRLRGETETLSRHGQAFVILFVFVRPCFPYVVNHPCYHCCFYLQGVALGLSYADRI